MKVGLLVSALSAGIAPATEPSLCSSEEERCHHAQRSLLQSQFTSRLHSSLEHAAQEDEHPLMPTCLGHGGASCASASASGPSGSAWQSSSRCQTLAMQVARPLGCATRPCWMQKIRVAMDRGNSLQSGARAGVYTSSGRLLASTDDVQVPAGADSDSWLELPFQGTGLELHATEAIGDLWVAVQFEQRVRVVYDAVAPGADATHVADEEWAAGLAASRDWAAETGRRSWSGKPRALRVQLFVGDISVLPGTLPLLIEAPHGGRIEEGWPARLSGRTNPDLNTDVFSESLRKDISDRCGGRTPHAVILRVARQGVDANRAVGDGTVTYPGNTPCSQESGGECCCHLPGHEAEQNAISLADAYQKAVLAAMAEAGTGSFILSMHGLARERVEVGVRLSGSRLNAAYGRHPPTLDSSDWSQSTFRALGAAAEQAELTWGATGLGGRLAETLPGMDVIPSPRIPCPDATLCPESTSESFFAGGHVLKISTGDTQAGVQIELPPSMRTMDGDKASPTSVRRVAAGVVAFLNEHWPALGPSCNADVNFGLNCGSHGHAESGSCVCSSGHSGAACELCAEGYAQQADGSCSSSGKLGVPAEELDSEKHSWAYSKSSTGRNYVYWRRADLPEQSCGAQGCPLLSFGAKVMCDSPSCYSSVSGSTYRMGAAVYSADGAKVCDALSEPQTPRADEDWWLRVPLSCPPLMQMHSSHVYLAFWFTKKLHLRWENERPTAERAHACTYDSDRLATDRSAYSADSCVDRVPPRRLPSWRDDDCEDLPTYKCRSWISSGVRQYFGPMIQLVYSKR